MMRRSIVLTQARAFLLIALMAAGSALALADNLAIPALTGRVVDQANILSAADESRLDAKSQSLETKTSIQLVVVTLRGLQDRTIEDWGLTLGRTWGIGQKGKDNGVLLIVAPNDRELRIEVGYGLEGTLPDATADAIIRNVIIPRFKAGNMAGGISDGADAIIAVLTGSGEEFTKQSFTSTASQAVDNWAPLLFVGFFIIMVIIAQFRDRRRRRGGRYYRNRSGGWLYVDDSDRSSWGGFSSGGRSGGGGFSGGGGSFGGGGASGRW
jgi:uncharacterized protein